MRRRRIRVRPTAAATIQDAIDISQTGDQILVTNGVYQTGGRAINGLTNRMAVTNVMVVQSVNGPATTVIQGYQDPDTVYGSNAVRCVYLADGAVLIGFTITNGATLMTNTTTDLDIVTGGGIYCENTNAVVSNCVFVGNAAYVGGGGASRGTYYYCAFSNNVTPGAGGGVYGAPMFVYPGPCVLSHCTLSANSADEGGGADNCALLSDCSINDNFAQNGGGVAGFG